MAIREDPDFYKISRFDIVFISLILFFSVFCIVWFNRGRLQQSQAGQTVLIYQKDTLIEKLSIKEDRTVALLHGKIQIEVKKGRIRVAKSDCPQHICMGMGWIRHSGETIVCVPNKVMIEIKSTGLSLIDAVAI